MTPFPPDENDKWRALLGMPQLSAPALSDPSMQPMQLGAGPDLPESPSDQPDTPGQQSQPAVPPGMEHFAALAHPNFDSIGSPPQATGPDKGQLALAMFADLLLNKGRSLGPLIGTMAQGTDAVDEENYRRRMQDAKDRAQMEHLQQGRAPEDPRVLALRQRGLDLHSRGLDLQEKQLNGRADAATGAREAAIALGADPKMIEGMTDAQVNAWKSAITSKLRQGDSNSAWEHRQGERTQATLDKEARLPGLRADVTTATTNARNNATVGAPDDAVSSFEAANPKLVVAEPGTFMANARNNRGAAQRQKALMTATRALDASARLRDLDQAYSDIPLFERAGGQAQQIKAEYDKLVNEHQGIISQISGMGAGSEADRAEIRDGIPSILNPLAHNKLAGIERMLHLNVAATLGPYGIGIRGESHGDASPISRETQARPDPGAFVPKGGYAPTAGDMPSDALTRPTTGQAAAPAQSRTVRMRDPATGIEADVPAQSVGDAWLKGLRPIQ